MDASPASCVLGCARRARSGLDERGVPRRSRGPRCGPPALDARRGGRSSLPSCLSLATSALPLPLTVPQRIRGHSTLREEGRIEFVQSPNGNHPPPGWWGVIPNGCSAVSYFSDRVVSIIGAGRLSFRVRDGTGRFPTALAAVTLFTLFRVPPRVWGSVFGGGVWIWFVVAWLRTRHCCDVFTHSLKPFDGFCCV